MKSSVAAPRRSLHTFMPVVALLLIIAGSQHLAVAQMIEDYADQRKLGFQLYKENNFTAALPVFERLAAANPKDREVVEYLGIMLIGSATGLKDQGERRVARARGRSFLVKAQEMGADDLLLKEMLAQIPEDGRTVDNFSIKKEVDDAMREGEAAFGANEFDKAVDAYGRALALDPKLYNAALFTGDVYYKSKKYDKAGEWFAKAIGIEPDRETAYRYWGDALMAQGRMSEARDKFVEAFLAAPYDRLSRAGLIQWANANQVSLAHPNIVIPSNVGQGTNGEINITLDSNSLKGDDTGTAAWMIYGIGRAGWQPGKDGMGKKFTKQFPNEKSYRHSLAEEMDGLGLVLISVKEQQKDGKIKKLEPSLSALIKLQDAGLLESYILLARPDAGIAQDYEQYRKANMEKLRRYLKDVVIAGGGSN